MKIDLDFNKWKAESDIRHLAFVLENGIKFRISVSDMEDQMYRVSMQRGSSAPYLYISYDRKGVVDLIELFLSDYIVFANNIGLQFPEWYGNDYLMEDNYIVS